MNKFPIPSAAARRLAPGIVLLLLVGCSSAPSRPVAVTAPPPPMIGSAPIAAYDDFALAIEPLRTTRFKTAIVVSAP